MSRKKIIKDWLLKNGFRQIYNDEFRKEIKINDDITKFIEFENYRSPEYSIYYLYRNEDLLIRDYYFDKFRNITKRKEIEQRLKEMLSIELDYKEKLKQVIQVRKLEQYKKFKSFKIDLTENFYFFKEAERYKKLFKLLNKLDNHLSYMKIKSYKLRSYPLYMIFRDFYKNKIDYVLKELIDNDKIFFIFSNYLSDKSYIGISYSGSKDDKIYLKDIDLRNYFTLEMLYKTNLVEDLIKILNQIQKESQRIYQEYLLIEKI